jgi:allantoicase
MPVEPEPIFHRDLDLATERNGGHVLAASDDFFAAKENLIKSAEPQFIEGKFTDRGKWMDGWESRRRRTPGNDWCIVKLGYRGIVKGVNIDTRHFNGNQPEKATIDAAVASGIPLPDAWTQILEPVNLVADAPHIFEIDSAEAWTHIRLNIFPDGGVARLRVFGDVVPDWDGVDVNSALELSSLSLGGRAVDCSGERFGPIQNLIHPSDPLNMGDGWETARRRGPGHDWAVIALGRPGILARIDVDTTHFKGNFPARCSIDGGYLHNDRDLGSAEWQSLVDETVLQADHCHSFTLSDTQHPVSHVRLNIFPDGGVARLRVFGRPETRSE